MDRDVKTIERWSNAGLARSGVAWRRASSIWSTDPSGTSSLSAMVPQRARSSTLGAISYTRSGGNFSPNTHSAGVK
jgi:hypothetical protein